MFDEAEVTYNTRVCCLPTFRFQILADLQHHFFVLGMRHLLIDPQVVTCLVVGRDWEILGVRRVHPVDINVHCLYLAAVSFS